MLQAACQKGEVNVHEQRIWGNGTVPIVVPVLQSERDQAYWVQRQRGCEAISQAFASLAAASPNFAPGDFFFPSVLLEKHMMKWLEDIFNLEKFLSEND